MSEFTGERVIPGLVDPDLLNEHLARYRFAARLTENARVLDAGCGSGYGAAELTAAASVIAVDVSPEALEHARRCFARPAVRFAQASCEKLPFQDSCFDVITAFEVIEHLPRWQDFLAEARRVLDPSGVLVVSTPNKSYYADSRGNSGPNPFHCHEFEYEEFEAALREVFPHVRLWTQNRTECFVFAPAVPEAGILKTSGEAGTPADPGAAHFFLAVCSRSPIQTAETFAWIPSSGNLLRERERHIAKLESELAKKDQWLLDATAALSQLQQAHEELTADLEKKNQWAAQLDRDVVLRDARIGQLQDEVDQRLVWVRDFEAQVERARTRISQMDRELEERTAWAQARDEDLRLHIEHHREELNRIANSRWLRLGRKLNLGPVIDGR